ncbi:hypothetical protein Tsp_08790, partial [Trichinella spiralis]
MIRLMHGIYSKLNRNLPVCTMEIIPGISETTDYCKSNSKAILCQLK